MLFAAITAGIIFVADIFIPQGVAFGVPYVVVILITLQTLNRRAIIIVAINVSLLILVGLALSPEV
jgi:hypothetical protein